MENAAKAKSVSDDDEAYRILKGKLSCLSILKDQLEVMGQDESLSPQEAAKFAEAKARIDSELEGVKNKLMSREKIHVKTWERENGINDDSIKTKLRTEKRTHPHVNAEALKIVGTMNTLMAEGKRPEYSAAYNNMEKKHSAFRNFGTFMNEKMAEHMLGKPKNLYVSSYFGVKRFVADEMMRYENAYPYVIGLVLRSTRNIVNVDVNHRNREIGTSGYTFSKLINLWINGFTAFSVKPLRIATGCGAVLAVLGFAYGIYTVIKRFLIPDIPMGYSALMSAVVFMGGMIMLMLGMLGEYIGRIYVSMNSSPQYVIKEKKKGGQN